MRPIVVDSSALVAILVGEPDRAALLAALKAASARSISAFSVLESSVVLQRRFGEDTAALLDRFLHAAGIEPIPLDLDQLAVARAAWTRFGKGRHRARLNLGDCCTYATAYTLDRPLLCQGDDFVYTDLELVNW